MSALAVAATPTIAKIRLPADPFIEGLIKSMTPEEKAGQLSIYTDPTRFNGPPLNPSAKTLQGKAALIDEISKGLLIIT